MNIGQLAQATHTKVETVRHCEREGWLPPPPDSEGNYRLYGPWHVERLAFVRHCRSLDMTLDEVRRLLRLKDHPSADCGEVNAVLSAHLGQVTARIRELQRLKLQLKRLEQQCNGRQAARCCNILNGLAQQGGRCGVPPQRAV